jgi:hypothetical protein
MRGRRPDGWSRIGSYHIRCTSVRTTAVRCPDGSFWTAILALWRYASGRDTTSSGRLIDLPFLELGKNQWTVRELIGVLICCWNVRTEQARTEASRYDVGVLTEETHRPNGWCLSVWCSDGMTRRPDVWNSRQMGVRTGWHIVRTADGELEILLITLKVESLFTASLHISDFVQTQNKAKILTNSPFGHSGTKITWPV